MPQLTHTQRDCQTGVNWPLASTCVLRWPDTAVVVRRRKASSELIAVASNIARLDAFPERHWAKQKAPKSRRTIDGQSVGGFRGTVALRSFKLG
ncbi:hypothetical protein PAXRUDRAFT_364751 [Paxillus rubicundulus Ve08.2h10]|uniref:Uncharacterized protein n=1 Tax=Paxillus rubicundulus Ve08.2h10 TaxID=930991 RepID=A0A0D0DZ64_9AGAM|nr:hypothetical protein PAXRUDRAFT_364751 [Paxillus rubicundulus Ve08.2h10]